VTKCLHAITHSHEHMTTGAQTQFQKLFLLNHNYSPSRTESRVD